MQTTYRYIATISSFIFVGSCAPNSLSNHSERQNSGIVTTSTDSYTGNTTISGPPQENMSAFAAGMSSTPHISYRLKAIKKSGKNDKPIVAASVTVIGKSWSFPRNAYTEPGIILDLFKVESEVTNSANTIESFYIHIPNNILNEREKSGLRIRVDGKRSLFITFTHSYINSFNKILHNKK
jgi:hypothetical protein